MHRVLVTALWALILLVPVVAHAGRLSYVP